MAIWGRAMRLTMLVAAAALAGAAIASACGSSSSNDNERQRFAAGSIDDLAARVQQDEMLNAGSRVSALPIARLDTTLQGGKIDGKYVPTLAHADPRAGAHGLDVRSVAAAAQKLHDDAVTLFQALDAGDDAATSQGRCRRPLHEDWHMFTPRVGDVVAKALPADAGGPRANASSGVASGPDPDPRRQCRRDTSRSQRGS